MKNIKIYPSILALKDSPETWNQRISLLPCAISGIHYDIWDWEFVPSFMLKPEDIQYLSQSIKLATASRRQAESRKEDFRLPIDVHLMVEKPSLYFPQILSFPEVDAVAIHVECDEDIHETIQVLRNAGKKVGLAILDITPSDHLDPYLLEVDYVLVMTVKWGYSGTPFIPEVLPKITEIRHKMPDLPIVVDGWVGEKTLPLCIEAGATGAVMSGALFGGGDLGWILGLVG